MAVSTSTRSRLSSVSRVAGGDARCRGVLDQHVADPFESPVFGVKHDDWISCTAVH